MERNRNVDIIRGIAMLMVVLGHTISGTCIDYEDSFIFRVIWTLQMPLFFIISGYVTRYSRPIQGMGALLRFIKKRSLAYLLPWFVWSFIVRGLVFGQKNFFDIRYLLWHMDTGYWFLVSLWTIVIIYGIGDYLSNRFGPKNTLGVIVGHIFYCLLGMIVIGMVGCILGMSFLSIKLSLYYMPLFLGGYIYGALQNKIMAWEYHHKALAATYGLSLAVWLFIITRMSFYGVEMSITVIIVRYIASVLGCVSVIGLISGVCGGGYLSLAGKYSLEIYLLHYLLLVPLRADRLMPLSAPAGFGMVVLEYILTMTLVTIAIILIYHNEFLNRCLFWKETFRREYCNS